MHQKKKKKFDTGPLVKLNIPNFKGIAEQFQGDRQGKGPKAARLAQLPPLQEASESPNQMESPVRPEGLGGPKKLLGKAHGKNEGNITASQEDLLKGHKHEENPWIQEAMKRTKISASKMIQSTLPKPKIIEKDKMQLSGQPVVVEKDEGVQLLDKEYEIFTDPSLPPTRNLTRFDCWEQDLSGEEWLEKCKEDPDSESDGLTRVYEDKIYTWKAIKLIDYDHNTKKFLVKVNESGLKKWITRLAILFNQEDPAKFGERYMLCKDRQQIVEAEMRWTGYIDSLSRDNVSKFRSDIKDKIFRRLPDERDEAKFRKKYGDYDHYLSSWNYLARVAEEEYFRQMKKCLILKDMEDPASHEKYMALRLPIRLHHRTAPPKGVVDIEPYNYNTDFKTFERDSSWMEKEAVNCVMKIFAKQFESFQKLTFMQTSRDIIRPPIRLSELKTLEDGYYLGVYKNIKRHWREVLVNELRENLQEKDKEKPVGLYEFFSMSEQQYEECDLKRIITRFDLIFNTHIRNFVKHSINDWVTFIKSFTIPKEGELWKLTDVPLLTIELKYRKPKETKQKKKGEKGGKKEEEIPGGIIFKPSLEETKTYLLSALTKILDRTRRISKLETRKILIFLSKQSEPAFDIDENHEWIVDAKKELSDMIDESMIEPIKLMEKIAAYQYILEINPRKREKELFPAGPGGGDKDKATVEQLQEDLIKIKTAKTEVENLVNEEMNYPMFRIITTSLIKEILNHAEKIMDRILEAIVTYCKTTIEEIRQTYITMLQNLSVKPVKEMELVKLEKDMEESKSLSKKLALQHIHVGHHMDILEEFFHEYPDNSLAAFWFLNNFPLQITEHLSDAHNTWQDMADNFENVLTQEENAFRKDLKAITETFEKIKLLSDLDFAKENATDVYDLNDRYQSATEKIHNFAEREEYLKTLPNKRFESVEFEKQKKEFQPFNLLWDTASTVEAELTDWMTQKTFKTLQPQDMEKLCQEWMHTSHNLYRTLNEDDYTEPAEVASQLKKKVMEFNTHLPIIKLLRTQALDNEDWVEIGKIITGLDLGDGNKDRQDDLTLKQVLDLGVAKEFEAIEEVSSKAEKRYALKVKLGSMNDEWKEVELLMVEHKSTFVIKGYDDIQTLVDDQIVATMAMLGSAYMKGKLKVRCKDWETKLLHLSDILDAIHKCQRTWMYLEPIFSSDDIIKQLPKEAKNFQEIDLLWRDTMDGISKEPGAIDLVDRENIKEHFEAANKKLDDIQKSLNDYLESKRLIFPRFFFLSNDELLMILSQTKDPLAVQPHMNKCFDGIESLDFDDNLLVQGMVSAENEHVKLIRPIDVNQGEKKGHVEFWLLEVEEIMIKTLSGITYEAMMDYETAVRNEWVLKWAGQIVLCVNLIHWTLGVEKAIEDYENDGMAKYENFLKAQLADIVMLIRGELTENNRITICALIVLDVHARDVVHLLVNKNIKNENDFDWIAQMRYVWDKESKLRVKMINAVLDYGFEYIGNSERLVITPLTDRCYRTLMGAKHLNYGGAPEGPAGTGKTETVKDLAKALAVKCVVFNCSDGLDYLAMAKFFKGLASSGAWCCFDEFNRIDLEVLSVVASQIYQIQGAIREKKEVFEFAGTEIKMNAQCAINITMNPGYAGRAELPDNLKALLRPCAMMVPDYALIAENMLYSFGFQEAYDLARKVVASLRLSSEQLSSQGHYDFGMRALKAILSAAGQLRRKMTESEDIITLRALEDVNLPKFTMNDIPLFLGITSDLFPGVKLPVPDYGNLEKALRECAVAENLQPKESFIQKCIQLYETIAVRHGLMLVGQAFSGKSSVIKNLGNAMGTMAGSQGFEKVKYYYIAPKAVTQEQLYGNFDADTHEWEDGILAMTIRVCADSETNDKKWVIFDGPVDAKWIENMNTVLDDNKKLCLSSGMIVKLKPTMVIMFEVEDLQYASPATVSRCGMVFLETSELGWEVLIRSYCNQLPEIFTEKRIKMIEEFMMWALTPLLNYIFKSCKFPCQTDPVYVTQSFLNLFETYIMDAYKEDYKLPNDFDSLLNNYLIFSLIWSVGAVIDQSFRPKFNELIIDMLSMVDVTQKFHLDPEIDFKPAKYQIKFVDKNTVFEQVFDKKKNCWINWMKTIPAYTPNKQSEFHELIIPTIDSVRLNYLMNTMALGTKHPLFVGPTGTGKTISIMSELKNNFNNEDYTYITLTFSSKTSANQTQNIIDQKLTKRRKQVYGPSLGKKGIIYVDDLNMPQKEIYGAQPPIELLRQWMDYKGWYDTDTPEKAFRKIVDVSFVAAMGPPSGGRAPLTARYMRHFNIIFIEAYDETSLQTIFSNIITWFFIRYVNPSFPKSMQPIGDQMVPATIETYKNVAKELRPTPSKSHYTYNLRDVNKVFQGVANANPKGIRDDNELIRLWAHECMRVFSDRLISTQDRDIFKEILKGIMKIRFKKTWEGLIVNDPLIFGSFVPMIYPEGDTTKKPMSELYCELSDLKKLKVKCEDFLLEFNQMSQTAMNIVLFTDALEHIVKIIRVIQLAFGHVLLVGVGGSGRKSLTTLASFIANYELTQLELTSKFGMFEWHNFMREIMIKAGVDAKPIVFMFSDTQIANEVFMEDLNNILNTGEIPNLFADPADYQKVIDEMRDGEKSKIEMMESEWFELFIRRTRQNMHVSLCLSPIGDDFRRRMRMFPSLINCCTIDWFLPWPEEALDSVAQHFLKEIDLEKRDGIVKICVDMQERVRDLTVRFKDELRRFYYVTPTSYLELIKTFTSLLASKRKIIFSQIIRYEKGLEQMAKAEVTVAEMKDHLNILNPQLKEKKLQTNALMETLTVKKAEVEEVTKVVAVEEAECKEKAETAGAIEAECKNDLAKVEPIVKKAEQAVKDLKPGDFQEFASYKNPPDAAKTVCKGLCVLFGVKGVKGNVMDKSKELNYWDPAKKTLLKAALRDRCLKFDRENINQELVKICLEIIESPDMSDDSLKSCSKAALGLGTWIKALIQFNEVMKVVKPKRAKLAEAKEILREANEIWAVKKKDLKEKQDLMQELQDKYDKALAEKDKLEKEILQCETRLSNAQKLISGLGKEKARWNKNVEDLRADSTHLVGDILISSGIIAYLGVFPIDYRNQCIDSWGDLLKKYEIEKTVDFKLQEVLGDPVRMRDWSSWKLPQDDVSVDNAIILENSSRWPLMIDPQLQANAWIRAMIKGKGEQLQIMKSTQDAKAWSRVLKNALTIGSPVLLEDLKEKIDPFLDPVLRKQLIRKGTMNFIKLGEDYSPFSDDFKFYMTTKLPRPHYSPEVCVAVSMLFFMATETGLQDQMLNIIVNHEKPEDNKKRIENIRKSAADKKKLKELQDRILELINNATGDILDDTQLISMLETSNTESAQINQQIEDQKKILAKIQKNCDTFEGVAFRVSQIFFCIADLANVEPMYQYSLEWYTNIFKMALVLNEEEKERFAKEKDVNPKLEHYKDKFTYLLYQSVCKSLFVKDKLLFSFLLCLKIQVAGGFVTPVQRRFLMSGATSMELARPNPVPKIGEMDGWLTDKTWGNILEVSKLIPEFKDFDKDFEKNLAAWEKCILYPEFQNSDNNSWPSDWHLKLEGILRVIIVNILRSDKTIPAIQNYVIDKLGKKFLKPPTFNLEESFNDSKKDTPIIFVLSPGADPLAELAKLAKKLGFAHKSKTLSLGQGQGGIAKNEIKVAQETGSWVVLQNCHLAVSFMPDLERIVEEIDIEKTDIKYRLWLTSCPSDQFPVSILQNGIKLTNEPPKGISNNMLRAYTNFDNNFFESCTKSGPWKKLLYGLCFFNSLVLERRKYGPLGWNIPYEFSQSDLTISISQLLMFLDGYEEIPYEALNYMVAEANYGGRVTDAWDRRCIKIILLDFYNSAILKDSYRWCNISDYYAPSIHTGLMDVKEYINNLPLNDPTDVFGLHQNADITSAISDAALLLSTSLSLLPRTTGEGGDQEAILSEKARQVVSMVQDEFDLEKAAKLHPIKYDESMNTVLQQELLRFNKLIRTVKNSLINLQNAIKGLVVMSLELEAVGEGLINNKLPQLWESVSYPSLKPLSSYIKDLDARLKFMQKWIDEGSPSSYWFSGFYFTQSFVTGTKQNYARKEGIAIDTLVFDFYMIPATSTKYDLTKAPEDGVYVHGLFLEGAKWNLEENYLDESEMKELFAPMPLIWFKPLESNKQAQDRRLYECPVYKTTLRRGVLSTTGHSTNFVLPIDLDLSEKHTSEHWVKRGVAMITQLND